MRGVDTEQTLLIPAGRKELESELVVPVDAFGLVLFAHGSGSSRKSPRNQLVAEALRERGLGTLLFDLLTPEEGLADTQTAHLRFDLPLLARRLGAVTDWIQGRGAARGLTLGYFGASTGAAAALIAASRRPRSVRAVVSRGGRPDLAGDALERVQAPTLLIVGGDDHSVLELNEDALDRIPAPKQLAIIPGATHLFEEPGALEHVARLAGDWFLDHLAAPAETRQHAHP